MHFDLENALRHETLPFITKWEKENYDAKSSNNPINTSIHVHIKIIVLLENTALINQQEMCI